MEAIPVIDAVVAAYGWLSNGVAFLFILTVNDVPATLNVWFLPAPASFHTPPVAILTFSTVTGIHTNAASWDKVTFTGVTALFAEITSILSALNPSTWGTS